jgi:hypothetical protein
MLLVCAFLLVPATARAEDDDDEQMVVVEAPAADPPPESPPVVLVRPASKPTIWVDVGYGSQTLLLDGAAVAMFAFGVASESQPLPSLGLLTYAFAPPIAHFTHGNVGKGVADMGIRLVSPFLFAMPGLMLATAFTSNDYDDRKKAMDIGGYTGMALGAAFAMVVDALVLAKERVPAERAYMTDDAGSRLTPYRVIACGECKGRGSSSSSSSSSP